MKSNRLVLLAAAGASLIAFTGCAPMGDVAIESDGTSLSSEDVDLFTTFLCNFRQQSANDPAAGGTAPAVPLVQARSEAARLLAESLVSDRAADAARVPEDLETVKQSLAQLEGLISSSARGADRERLTELLVSSISASSRVETSVRNEMVAELGESINQLPQDQGQAIFDQKYGALIARGLEGADLEIDPVFGIDQDTLVSGLDSSLSRPVSDFAVESVKPQPSADWLAALPANLRCG